MNASPTESLRLFFALWPDDATRAELTRLQIAIHGRFIAYENLHLTLAFLGQQPAALLPELKEILSRLSPTAFTLHLDRLGYFTRNRIAWAGMHDVPDALLTLQQELTQKLRQSGVSFNDQTGFRPHITLARDASLTADVEFEPIVWNVDEIALLQSESTPQGARYRLLASRALNATCWTKNVAAGDAIAPRFNR